VRRDHYEVGVMAFKEYKIDFSKESGHQRALFLWAAQPSVLKKYPELALLFHIKNETKEGAAAVAYDRTQGVKKGVPDLFFPCQRGRFGGMFIEMKTPKGRVRPAQLQWIRDLEDQGYFACVCYGWEEARDRLLWYLNLN
jgi:hypothetical protein